MTAPRRKRAALVAGLSAALAGGAVAIGVALRHESGERAPTAAPAVAAAKPYAVCLKTAFPLIKGADKKCYDPAGLDALEDQPVLGAASAAETVALSSPTDASSPTKDASTCREYNQLTDEGWYAMTSREMRREDYFKRACGALALLRRAKAPEVTYFADGELTEEDVRSAAAHARFLIGPAGTPAPEPVIEKGAGESWRIATGDQIAILQPIAHADFDDDGRGDMLVFVAMRIEGGTAAASRLGLLQKSADGGPVTFEAEE
ncbi:MAG: hypothetical protein GC153_11110 [Alphaproteobacteria bacterium]|nr:hypothetical protein [Alphaproteobacteria bacterium]